jgi:hypothetical protein
MCRASVHRCQGSRNVGFQEHPETWIGIAAMAIASWTTLGTAWIGYLRYRDHWKRQAERLKDRTKTLQDELIEAKQENKELRAELRKSERSKS